jgi:hypothetical protein
MAVELALHLIRLLIWSAASSALAMLPILWRNQPPWKSDFQLMLIAWNVVNLAIVFFSWNTRPGELASTREFLALNLGLNVAYLAAGLTSALPVASTARMRGFGFAIALQGVALLALDTWLYFRLPTP